MLHQFFGNLQKIWKKNPHWYILTYIFLDNWLSLQLKGNESPLKKQLTFSKNPTVLLTEESNSIKEWNLSWILQQFFQNTNLKIQDLELFLFFQRNLEHSPLKSNLSKILQFSPKNLILPTIHWTIYFFQGREFPTSIKKKNNSFFPKILQLKSSVPLNNPMSFTNISTISDRNLRNQVYVSTSPWMCNFDFLRKKSTTCSVEIQ